MSLEKEKRLVVRGIGILSVGTVVFMCVILVFCLAFAVDTHGAFDTQQSGGPNDKERF